MTITATQHSALGEFLRESGVASSAAAPELTRLVGGRSNLTYRLSTGDRTMLLRRPPVLGAHASAHDISREWRVTSALHAAGFPVPAPIRFCEDTTILGSAFSLTEFVDGPVLRDRGDVDPLSDAELDRTARELVSTLARLHALDPAEVGLDGFGRQGGYVTRQLAMWRRQWDVIKADDSPDFERLHDLLADRVPRDARTTIVHGDYRVDNVILRSMDDLSIRAVIDWELSTLGDPLADVAMLCAYRHESLDDILGFTAAWSSPRFPTPADLIDLYVERSPGTAYADWAFYLAFAYFKIAAISQGIAYRAKQGADSGGNGTIAARAVPRLVATGLAALDS